MSTDTELSPPIKKCEACNKLSFVSWYIGWLCDACVKREQALVKKESDVHINSK